MGILAFFAPLAWADYVIVLNSAGDTLSLIDPKQYKEVGRLPIGKGPHHLMSTPDDSHLLVGNTLGNDLVYLDRKTGAIQKRLPMADPYQLGFSPDKKWFVTAAIRQDFVDIYEGDGIVAGTKAQAIKRVKTGRWPSHLAFTPDSKFVYVTEQGANRVTKIELATQKVVAQIPVGKEPAGIQVTPDDKHVLVGIMGEDHLAIIERATDKNIGKLFTGKGAHNIFPWGDKRHALVSNRVDNTLSKIDQITLKVVDTYPVPGGPDCLEIVPDAKEIWVTSRWIQKVSVIDMDTKKLKAQIPVGRSPHGIYYHRHAPRF
jgi:YVTN family beta-propeller protein